MPLENYAKTHDGGELNYLHIDNSRPPAVLVHGLTMDHESWHHQIHALKHHYSIIAYDIRGHGKSSKPAEAKEYTIENQARDVETVANHLGLEKFALIGFSFGGSISFKFAEQHPERLEKLVTINAPYSLKSIKKKFFLKYAIARNLPKSLLGIGLDDSPIWEYKTELELNRKTFIQADKEVIENIMKAMVMERPKFRIPEVEHLLIYSTKDSIVKAKPPEGTNHRIIEGGEHYVIAQKPHEVNHAIRKFLE